jgi:hypothetical protein
MIALNSENYYSGTNGNYTTNLTVLCVQDGEIYFGVRWLMEKWGKPSASYIKPEGLHSQEPNVLEPLPVGYFLALQPLRWGSYVSRFHPGIQSPPQFLASLIMFKSKSNFIALKQNQRGQTCQPVSVGQLETLIGIHSYELDLNCPLRLKCRKRGFDRAAQTAPRRPKVN